MWVGLEGLVWRGSAGTRGNAGTGGKMRGHARAPGEHPYCSADVSFSTLSM